jgi:hypothetical protein
LKAPSTPRRNDNRSAITPRTTDRYALRPRKGTMG